MAAAAVSEPALHRLLTFQVPNHISLFRCLGCTEVSVQVRGFLCEHFVTWYMFIGGLSSIRNLRTRRGVVTGIHLSWLFYCAINQKRTLNKLLRRKILQDIRKQFYVLHVICTANVPMSMVYNQLALRKYFVTSISCCAHKLSSGEILKEISPNKC
jgi:hypothetical protein